MTNDYTMDRPDRTELMIKYIRDYAVVTAMTTHEDSIPIQERGNMQEIISLAVHLALVRFKAQHDGEFAEVTSYMRMKADNMHAKLAHQFIQSNFP